MITKYDNYTKEELIFLLIQCDEVIEDLHRFIRQKHKEVEKLHKKIDHFRIPPSNA